MSDPTEGEDDVLPENAPASAVDEPQRRRRESKAQRKEREDREFFRFVVESEVGRRFLWAILNDALHAFEVKWGYTPAGMPHDHASWMFLGEQQAGQRQYQTWFQKAPEAMMKMVVENDPRFARV